MLTRSWSLPARSASSRWSSYRGSYCLSAYVEDVITGGCIWGIVILIAIGMLVVSGRAERETGTHEQVSE